MIDYWCNAFTPDRAALWAAVIEQDGLALRTRSGATDDDFATPAEMVRRMDRLGITALIIPTCDLAKDAPINDFGHYAARPAEVATLVDTYPGRFYSAHSVDPGAGNEGAVAAAAALDQAWCIGLHTHTHSWDRRFDDESYLPFYDICAARQVPFVMQAGASGGNFSHDCGRPEAIAAPATAFPTVQFVLSHTGAPWVTETIAAASEFANVSIGTATHPPRRWPAQLVDFLSGPGRTKTLFGTGFPLTGHDRSLRQLQDLSLDPTTRHALLEGTARRIFTRIPDQTGG
jgi:predicted TIM-barrel fold metal-dependent hydrolase